MTLAENNYYDAITVISPMYDGDEKKGQDRAAWFPVSQVACVCDGVTSSPFSAEAAELVSCYSPVLFSEEIRSRMQTLCDLLMVMRNEKLSLNINLSPGTTMEMQKMLQQAAYQKISNSFQTTMAAAKFVRKGKSVISTIIRCGDSMFLAFNQSGELLASSPCYTKTEDDTEHLSRNKFISNTLRDIDFSPGDELLAKFLCSASKCPQIAVKAGIKTEHLDSWYMCIPLDKCHNNTKTKELIEGNTLHLNHRHRLLVPRYLCGSVIEVKSQSYIRFPYAQVIRLVDRGQKSVEFHYHGATTAVLPDHVYPGNWTYFKEVFSLEASFVLATDGFYSCFENPLELWSWLNEHRKDLQDSVRQKTLLNSLHHHLHKKHSDDDISFVWIYPMQINKRFSKVDELNGQGGTCNGI